MKKIHFIGIGGIGVSALAKIYLQMGWQVTGSDLASSEITKDLTKKRVKVFLGQQATNVSEETDLVVFSPAVQSSNEELQAAKKLGIESLSYPQALGKLSKDYFTIAVSGTHGKSTTTSMLALVMIKAGLDPTVVVGTKLKEFKGSNARMGKSKYLLIEADEYAASFLNYWPQMIVLTNIEADHLDYYKDLSEIMTTFQEYVSHLPNDGLLIVNKSDHNCRQMKAKQLEYYSLTQSEAKKIKEVLVLPGTHNVANALASLTAARRLGIEDEITYEALSEFKGTWRRFEIVKDNPYVVISDYAHHPTEVRALLQATREKYPMSRIICVYQPHQYQRTKLLFKDFVKAFKDADLVVLTEIFEVAGRERKDVTASLSSKDLVKEICLLGQKAVYFKTLSQSAKYLQQEIKEQDIVLIVGAGDIYKLSTDKSFKIVE